MMTHALTALKEEPATGQPDARPPRSTRLTALRDRVQSFARLPEGWAGDGTIPPSRQVVGHVDRLLLGLPEDMTLPYATASGEGEIGLTWFRGEDRLSATASPEGHLLWVSKVGGQFLDGEILPLASESFKPLHKAFVHFLQG